MKDTQRIVIIGSVAAGPKVAARARRLLPQTEITIIERDRLISYAGCGMPFYIAGQIKDFRQLFTTSYGAERDEEYFLTERNVNVLTLTEALSIDRNEKEVRVINKTTKKESTLPYDKLVLATGSSPIVPPIKGLELKGVHRLKHPNDAQKILAGLDGVSEVVVIGSGLIGMEAADAMIKRRMFVTVIELKEQILPGVLDGDLAKVLKFRLEEQGVEFRLGEQVQSLEGDEEGRVAKVVTDKDSIDAQLVIVAVGVRPNVELAKAAGLVIGETGAIEVNEYLQTSDPDIYALGDCVETLHLVSNQKVYLPLASNAVRQGRVVGDNLAGVKSKFKGVLGTAVAKLMDINIGRTGLGEEQAREAGFKAISTLISTHDRAHYYPGHDNLLIKLISDEETGHIIGAQVIGGGDVVKRIDVFATAINFRARVDDLAEVDLGYAPPFSMPLDPVHHSVNTVRNKIKGLAKGINAEGLNKKLMSEEDFILLDVRTVPQYKVKHISDKRLVVIPLDELRKRCLEELPRDKEIIVICALGTRSYEAQRILEEAGFKDVKFLEGGLQAWPYELD